MHHRQASDDVSEVSTQSSNSSWSPVPRAPSASDSVSLPRQRPPPPPPFPLWWELPPPPWPPGGQPWSYNNNTERYREMGFSPPLQLQPTPTRNPPVPEYTPISPPRQLQRMPTRERPVPEYNSPWNGRRRIFVTPISPPQELRPTPTREPPPPEYNSPWNGRRRPFVTPISLPRELQPMPTHEPLAPQYNSPWNGRRRPFDTPISPPTPTREPPAPEYNSPWITATGDGMFQEESDCETSSASDDQWSGQCEVGGLLGAIQRFFFRSQRDRQPRNSLEESMMCPIQRQIMVDPVIDPEGFSYEREAILKWLKCSPVSPITRRPLAARDLKTNRALKAVIQEYMKSRYVA